MKNRKIKNKEPLYIHLHMPRTGGETSIAHLRKKLNRAEYTYLNIGKGHEILQTKGGVEGYLKRLSKLKKSRLKLVHGHEVYFGIDKFFDRKARYITFLRNPVDRVMSHYNYLMDRFKKNDIESDYYKKKFEKNMLENGKIMSFDRFLEKSGYANNFMTRFLYKKFTNNEVEKVGRKELETVKKYLDKFYFVGICKNFEEQDDYLFFYSLFNLTKSYTVANTSIKYLNVKDKPELRKKILKRNKFDLELYNHALKLNKKFKQKNKHFYSKINYLKSLNLGNDRREKKISVMNVSKKFKIGFKKNQSALARTLSLFSGKSKKKDFWALKNISFDIYPKEIVGLIGENGSGKSTLLRIISGIYPFSEGSINVHGKIIPLIGLDSGFKYRLTMKDNIFILGRLLGLSKKDIRKKFNSIVKFSELDDFLNTKLFQFSSGMIQRLSFSIAINANPDILVLDEIFAVGDESFRRKSANKIKELSRKGVTVLFAGHELWMIEEYCDRVIWMNKGRILKQGKSKEIVKEYIKCSQN